MTPLKFKVVLDKGYASGKASLYAIALIGVLLAKHPFTLLQSWGVAGKASLYAIPQLGYEFFHIKTERHCRSKQCLSFLFYANLLLRQMAQNRSLHYERYYHKTIQFRTI